MAVLPNSYRDTQFDGLHVQLVYNDKQPHPSPVLMPAYEGVKQKSPAQFYKTHKELPLSSAPCFSGDRVKSYIERRDYAQWIALVADAFSLDYDAENNKFHNCPANINVFLNSHGKSQHFIFPIR